MTTLEQLETLFPHERYRRLNPAHVISAFKELLCPRSELLTAFYMRFCGPIGSEVTGFQLLDAVQEIPCIVSATRIVRSKYELGRNWVVLTDIVGDGMLMYDTATDHVFDVDFEASMGRMKAGELTPMHSSLDAFFRWFFQLDSTVAE